MIRDLISDDMENATLEPAQATSLVEIMYLSGERKGEVDCFNNDIISFGRSPECDVIFQGAALTVSRIHAKILKKDQQYYLENMGPNGCFVNGARVQRALLCSGDVIKFSASGPKIRVLYRNKQPGERNQSPRAYPLPPDMELTIQFAANTQTFCKDRVLLGSDDGCDFILKNEGLQARHIQLRVRGRDCYIEPLAGEKGVLLNGRYIQVERKLETNDIVRLSNDGPRFVYLGDGKLIQQEEKKHHGFEAQSNDSARTYIIPAKPTLLGNLKSVLRNKKEDAE